MVLNQPLRKLNASSQPDKLLSAKGLGTSRRHRFARRDHAAWRASDPGTSLFIGSRSFTRARGGDCRPDRDFPLFVRWYLEGKLKLDELVTRRSALEQINQAVDDLEHGRILGRAIITLRIDWIDNNIAGTTANLALSSRFAPFAIRR